MGSASSKQKVEPVSLHPDLPPGAANRLEMPSHIVPRPTKASSKGNLRAPNKADRVSFNGHMTVVDMDESTRIINEQEIELVRLRRQVAKLEAQLKVFMEKDVQQQKANHEGLKTDDHLGAMVPTKLNSAAAAAGKLVLMKKKERKVILAQDQKNKDGSETAIAPKVIVKSDSVRRILWEVCMDNLLFADLDDSCMMALTDPFENVVYAQGDMVIKQGDEGRSFYIVESGLLRIYVKSDKEEPGAEACVTTSPEEMTKEQTHETLGKFVHELGPHTSFGELALMYNTPRAATVRAAQACKLWKIARDDCRAVLQKIQRANMKQRIAFLRNVKIGLHPAMKMSEILSDQELSNIAEALSVEKVVAGTIIVRQGEPGNHFYIVESGRVTVHRNEPSSKRRMSTVAHDNKLKTIEEGGYFGERALIKEDVRAASVKAEVDCKLLTLSRVEFDRHLGQLSELLADAHALKSKTGEERGSLMSLLALEAGKLQTSPTIAEDAAVVDDPANKARKAMVLEDLENLGTLGAGSFGVVRLVRHKETGRKFACKCQAKVRIIHENMMDYVLVECKILSMCDSPYVLRLFSAIQNDRYVYLVLELLPGGELYALLQKMVCFSEPMLRFYVSQIVLALQCLHSHRVLYRDLKPENLVLDEKGFIKVVDFGLSKILTGWKTWTMCGTPEYLAPEILRNEGHNHAVDFWMLGVLIFELAYGQGPFVADDEMALFELILKMRPKYPRSFSKHLRDLISKLLSHQNRRLGNSKEGWMAVRKHFWFSGYDWEGIENKQITPPLKPNVNIPADYKENDPPLLSWSEKDKDIPCPHWTPTLPAANTSWR